MFARIWTIALNTYRESVRARILLGLAGVACAVAFYLLIVGAFTLNEAPRVVADLGAAATSVFSIAVAIVIGATSLHRELEQKTIFPLLARPIRRTEYLIGKYFGTMLVVTVFILAEGGLILMMGAVLAGGSAPLVIGVGTALAVLLGVGAWRSLRWRNFVPIPWAVAMFVAGFILCGAAPLERNLVLNSSLLCFLEVAIIAALVTLFSSFSTPFLSSLLTIGAVIVGRSADALSRLPKKFFGDFIHNAGKTLAAVVPNLHIYVPERPLLTGEAADVNTWHYIGMAAVQSVAYSVALLALASFVFKRRDFL
jgi:ABC-type transport system involved in multi-copper enzyme maturation permease subunit